MTDPDTQLTIDSVDHVDGPELRVAGELDMRTADRLERAVGERTGADVVVRIDLSAVSFCDSAGLSALVRLCHRLDAAGGHLVLVSPSARVRRVLDLTGLTAVFTIVDPPAGGLG